MKSNKTRQYLLTHTWCRVQKNTNKGTPHDNKFKTIHLKKVDVSNLSLNKTQSIQSKYAGSNSDLKLIAVTLSQWCCVSPAASTRPRALHNSKQIHPKITQEAPPNYPKTTRSLSLFHRRMEDLWLLIQATIIEPLCMKTTAFVLPKNLVILCSTRDIVGT